MEKVLAVDEKISYLPASKTILFETKLPRNPVRKETLTSLGIATWGDNNLFPNEVYEKGKKSTIIGGENGIPFLIKAIYGDGIAYGFERYDNIEKKIVVDERPTPELNRLIYHPATLAALKQSIHDHFWFRNRMPRLIFSADKSKVLNLYPCKALHTRWKLQDDNGIVRSCKVNANWDLFVGEDARDTIELPVISAADFLAPGAVRADGKNTDYVFRGDDAGNQNYYNLAPWHSAIESDWYDVAMAIPKFKKYLMENQMTIKYVITIPDWWWEEQAGGKAVWDKQTPQQRQDFRQKKKEEINNFLSGLENSGKSLFTSEKTLAPGGNQQLAKPLEGLRIAAVEKQTFSSEYLEDSAEASTHLMWALGIDPRLIGDAPGSNRSGGAGSDKEEAFNIFLNLCKAHADLILEPLLWAAQYNGLDPDYSLRIWFKRPFFRAQSDITPAERKTTPKQ